MTQEYKKLLLKDLLARLLYGVKVLYNGEICTIDSIFPDGQMLLKNECGIVFPNIEDSLFINLEDVKPYLRPMSSMTEEEIDEFTQFDVYSDGEYVIPNYETIDWLNVHHFDYRGLIEKGLALEAPEGMYN